MGAVIVRWVIHDDVRNAAQGPEWTGRIVTIADLRKYGAVRPRTRKEFDD